MNFEEFKDWAKENIKFFLPDHYKEAKVDVSEVVKTGMSYSALTVRNENQAAAPAVNLDRFYEEHLNDVPLFHIGTEMAKIVTMPQQNFNLDFLNDYDSVKDHLFVRVCNVKDNAEMLKNVPHTVYEDIALTYHIKVNDDRNGIASAMISNDLMNKYGVSLEQLNADCIENSQKILPAHIDSMMNTLFGLSGEDMDFDMPNIAPPSMMVITNNIGINGAAAFFYPDVMDKVADVLGSDFYMLPSSIHEVIAIPVSMNSDYRDLEDMVKSINEMQVAKDEQLSDHVYHYDAKDKVFELASRHEERISGKEKQSLLGRLAEKKKEAAVLNDSMPDKHKSTERAM